MGWGSVFDTKGQRTKITPRIRRRLTHFITYLYNSMANQSERSILRNALIFTGILKADCGSGRLDWPILCYSKSGGKRVKTLT